MVLWLLCTQQRARADEAEAEALSTREAAWSGWRPLILMPAGKVFLEKSIEQRAQSHIPGREERWRAEKRGGSLARGKRCCTYLNAAKEGRADTRALIATVVVGSSWTPLATPAAMADWKVYRGRWS